MTKPRPINWLLPKHKGKVVHENENILAYGVVVDSLARARQAEKKLAELFAKVLTEKDGSRANLVLDTSAKVQIRDCDCAIMTCVVFSLIWADGLINYYASFCMSQADLAQFARLDTATKWTIASIHSAGRHIDAKHPAILELKAITKARIRVVHPTTSVQVGTPVQQSKHRKGRITGLVKSRRYSIELAERARMMPVKLVHALREVDLDLPDWFLSEGGRVIDS